MITMVSRFSRNTRLTRMACIYLPQVSAIFSSVAKDLKVLRSTLQSLKGYLPCGAVVTLFRGSSQPGGIPVPVYQASCTGALVDRTKVRAPWVMWPGGGRFRAPISVGMGSAIDQKTDEDFR